MKKLLISLMVLLGSMNLLASPATTSGKVTFGVKQTIVFTDNTQIEIFYIKDSEGYKVFSETDLAKQSLDRLLTTKSTTMELCTQYRGKMQYSATTVTQLRNTANALYRQLNSWLDNYTARTGKSLESIFDII